MSSRKWTTAAAVLLTALHASFTHAQALSTQEELGKFLFFDTNLSDPNGQACASCHDPNVGFAEPDQHLPVSEGVIPGRFGTRNAPAAAYAVGSPCNSLASQNGRIICSIRSPISLICSRL